MSVVNTFDMLYDKLKVRTLGNVTTLHFANTPNVGLSCLDFGIEAQNLDTLIAMVSKALDEMQPGAVLPIAPKDEWLRIWDKPMIWRRVFQRVHNKVTGRPVAIVMVNVL